MRYLTLAEVLALHHRLMQESGGPWGLRDLGLLESAVAQPLGAFGAQDLYPSLVEKAAALAYSLVSNHPFVDGNKRVAPLGGRQAVAGGARRLALWARSATEQVIVPGHRTTR